MSPLYGVVLCGGRSTRMGADKGLLYYHQQPQRYHLYHLLGQICDKAVISCNEEQAGGVPDGYNLVRDSSLYKDIGPMAGLLSLFDAYPQTSFLVVGCDYPFIEKDDLLRLVSLWKDNRKSIVYVNREGVEEPLLAVYNETAGEAMRASFAAQRYSLRRYLQDINAITVKPLREQALQSIDSLDDYQKVINSKANNQ